MRRVRVGLVDLDLSLPIKHGILSSTLERTRPLLLQLLQIWEILIEIRIWSRIRYTGTRSHRLHEIRRSHIQCGNSIKRSAWTIPRSKHWVLEAICLEKRYSICSNLTRSQPTILMADLGLLVVRELLCLEPLLLLLNHLYWQVAKRCLFGSAMMLSCKWVHSDLIIGYDCFLTDRD